MIELPPIFTVQNVAVGHLSNNAANVRRVHYYIVVMPRSINVMEQMVWLMEQHAEQLEDKVAERTAELNQEKGKVERLLYNILPKWVLSLSQWIV